MSDEKKHAEESHQLVVVGSSAGGIEALSIFVSTLRADFPAPIVLAQHLDPTRPSSLDVILQRKTTLPVEVVTTSTHLQAGHIYVVPSNHHVSINDHRVEVQDDRLRRPRPSVDTLLTTAANAYGEHLLAAILTGSGSDGAVGAVDVKNAGGTVIVQNPQTARYPSMPLALPPTIIDFEASVEQIGPLLYDLLTGESIPQMEERTEDVLREILGQVSYHANVDFRPYKTSTILRRIGRRMTVRHNRSMREYSEYLKVHPEEVGELVNAFLINVTQFFRDVEAFAYLKSDILPQLISRARERDRVLRFWTAGCATGEEPYSLAMLLTDLLGAELPEWSIKIFATDLDEATINFARRGLYSENLLKNMPDDYRERFFERVDHGYRIAKTLRQMVIFGQQDLSRSAPFPRIDLVLCRNVLIYFTPELQDYVLNQFAFSLSPNGYLFLGKAETVRPIQTFYELVNKHWKVYRCVGNALPSMRHPMLSEMSARSLEGRAMSHQNRPSGKPDAEQEPSIPALEIGQLRRFNELLLRFLPVGVVVIDRAYHILTVNGSARRLLGLRDVGSEQDFLHAVRGIPYHTTRAAIDSVFRERNSVNLPEIELDAMNGGSGRYLSLAVTLMQIEASEPDLAVISVSDVTQQVQIRRQLETVQTEQAQLMNELGTTNKRLNDVNKELTDANEELQVANEELVLTHEELQASIEEFETTNEELQATNEELETNNEELQATNEELETTNDELRARTAELQELTSILENERGRLAEMVELAPFYILVLQGSSLIVEAYNPRYARLLEGRAVQGRPLDEVIDLFWGAGIDVVHSARDAYRLDQVQTTPRILTYLPRNHDTLQDEQRGAYFVYTIVPSHDVTGKVDGVVLYAIDETEQRLHEVEEEYEHLKLIFDNFSMAAMALFDAQTTNLIMGSPRYIEAVGAMGHLSGNSLVGQKWHDITFLIPPKRAADAWAAVLESHKALRIPELTYQSSPDEQAVIWDYTLIPLMNRNSGNKVHFILILAVDITEQVEMRHAVEQLDVLKEDFLSLATHELRTPLTALQGNVQVLQRSVRRRQPNETEQQEQKRQELVYLERIMHQIGQINRLITEMLDGARLSDNVFNLHNQQHVNLVRLVQRVVEQYADQKHVVKIETEQNEILVTCDENRIEQVLHNLIINALKYSPEDQPVMVTVRPQDEPAADVVVAVRDHGAGIQEQDQAHVFERFYRTEEAKQSRREGLGLGLYIAYEIIRQQGGSMWLESQPGLGSTFFFALQCETEPSEAEA